MNERELVSELTKEGFSHIFVWEDAPNTDYPEHTHRTETANIILGGEMTLIMNGESKTYRVGDRCDVPAGATHTAKWVPPAAAT